MDRHDAKPSRPSLLAGAKPDPAAAGPARPSPARILADIETPAGTRTGTGSRGWRIAGALLSLALFGVIAWWLLAPDPVPAGDRAGPPARASADAAAAETGSALIIDDAPPRMGQVAMPDPDSDAAASTEAPADAVGPIDPASPFQALATTSTASQDRAPAAGDNPFAGTTARPRPRTAAPLKTARRVQAGNEPDLLSVLLGNIRGGEQAPASGLDAFLLGLQAEEAGSSSAPQRNGRPLRVRSEQIQSNLRECPPPNTAEGLQCRQEICAVYAGRDPACPAG